MTSQEQQLIDGLISRIRGTQVENKDTEAEQYIQQGLAGYPDAIYVLAQTVLVQQYGLQQAKAQMDQLKQQNDQLQQAVQSGTGAPKSSGGSFLSHLFGSSPSNAPSQPQQTAPGYQPVNNPGYAPQGYPPPPPNYPPQAYPPPSGGFFGGGGGGFGGGGFLSGALQTAAGVAAGEAVFTGMEDLFHGFEHRGGEYAGGFGGGGQGSGETIINNYYDGDDRGGDRDRGERFDAGDHGNENGFYNPSDDASRQDLTGNADDSSSFDNSANLDDSSNFDDSSSFDNGGGFDDSNDFNS